MVFYTVRELRNNAKDVRETIRQNGEVVITNNGKPWALMIDIADDNLLETVQMLRTARAQRAIMKIREQAVADGIADLPLEEINAEIAAYRAERRAKEGSVA
ncbi:MAG: type II toxin-antitoxin system prevent-host-death family antitoxin [Coriobacteriia bacterium]|nr:type II toxin-antitoxin system prevent-host-death family antitoxin [Coriobacteriia bacterium]